MTKRLVREKIWLYNIDQIAIQTVKQCITCHAKGPEVAPEHLRMSQLPRCSWTVVCAKYKGRYGPNSEYILVAYSRYPGIHAVKSANGATAITVMNSIFRMFGIPDALKTDTCPQFDGDQCHKFAKHLGFHHRRIPPLWPRTDSEVERFTRNINNVVQVATTQGRSLK